MIDSKICRACQKLKANRPRGLCWSCYYTPGLLDLFPIKDCRFNRRGLGLKIPQFNPIPTQAKPGSEEKLRILEERAAKGQYLWHPDDARMEE